MQKTPLDTAHPHKDNRRREGAGSLPPARRGLRPGGNNQGEFQLYAEEHWPWARVSF